MFFCFLNFLSISESCLLGKHCTMNIRTQKMNKHKDIAGKTKINMLVMLSWGI